MAQENKKKLAERSENVNVAKVVKDKAEHACIEIDKLFKAKSANKIISFKAVALAATVINLVKQKMAAFDIKQATAIVQVYNGSTEHLDAFVDSPTLLAELTAAGRVQTALKCLRTRLTAQVRIGRNSNHNTSHDLIEDVKSRCEAKTSPEAKINAVKERDQKIMQPS